VSNKEKAPEKECCDSAREDKVSELDILRQSVEDKQKQADEYYDQLVRLKAEFENFRKRSERDKHNHMMWGKEDILIKQVGILDILQQAYQSTMKSSNIEAVQKGLDLIVQEFIRMLSSEGITEIDCEGKKFDPLSHEAVDHVESDSEEGTIVEVLQKGYMFKEKLLRAAKVRVAKSKQAKKE
jgi:molecular chaperone GrpE